MTWNQLAVQFCVELAFGVLVAIALVPRAPLGGWFHRLMGASVVAPLLVAAALRLAFADAVWQDPTVLLLALAILAFPLFSGSARSARWWWGWGAAVAGTTSALVLSVRAASESIRAGDGLGWAGVVLPSACAMATGAVAGVVGLSMVFGHWYLTVPKLDVRHLRRLNGIAMATILSSLFLLALSCAAFGSDLGSEARPLFSSWGLFFLGTRVAVGLVLPLLFSWMAHDALRFNNTRSATGILYASTVLVLIGTAASLSLQGSYGVPL